MLEIKPPRGSLLNKKHPLSRGLVGCWLFNEGTGLQVTDLSENRNNGVITGSTSVNWSNNGFIFDGTDTLVNCGTGNTLNDADPFTIVWKMNLTGYATGDYFISKGSGTTNGMWRIICQNNGVHSLQFQKILVGTDISAVWNNALTASGRRNYALTWNGGNNSGGSDVALYLNGLFVSTTSTAGGGTVPRTDASFEFYIGNNGLSPSGIIEYVFFYNRVLTAEEIFQLNIEPFQIINQTRSTTSRMLPITVPATPTILAPRPANTKPPRGTLLDKEHPLSRDLIGCWLMNEGTGTKIFNLSKNRFHGTLTNAASSAWTGSGRGLTLEFDGVDDYISIGDIEEYDFDGAVDFTVCARIYPHTWGESNLGRVIAKENTTNGWKMFLVQTGFSAETSNNSFAFTQGGTHYGTSASSITLREWHDCAVIKDGSNLKGYVNGQLKMNWSGVSNNTTVTDPVVIGTQSNSLGALCYKGFINHVFLYNKALSVEEIFQLHINPYQIFKIV